MGKITIYAIILGALAALAIAFVFNSPAASYTKEVEVTAEVKPSCTEDVYREDCIRRVTDALAKALSELVAQEDIVQREIDILDEKREAFNQAAFNVETIANK